MLGKITGVEGRRPGGQSRSWHRCLLDLNAFDATNGSTEHFKLVFEVEAEVWTIAAKKAGKWYRRSSTQPSGSWLGGTRMKRI